VLSQISRGCGISPDPRAALRLKSATTYGNNEPRRTRNFYLVLEAVEYFFGEKLNCLIDVTVAQKKVCITLDAPAREEFTESASIKRGGSSQTNH
jgi:hypothetical protein